MFQVEFWDFDCKSKSKRSAENLKNVSQTSPPLHLIFENFDFYGIDFFFPSLNWIFAVYTGSKIIVHQSWYIFQIKECQKSSADRSSVSRTVLKFWYVCHREKKNQINQNLQTVYFTLLFRWWELTFQRYLKNQPRTSSMTSNPN